MQLKSRQLVKHPEKMIRNFLMRSAGRPEILSLRGTYPPYRPPFVLFQIEQVRWELLVYAAAHVAAAEVVDSPEPSPSGDPVLITVSAAAVEHRGKLRRWPVAGIEQLEVGQDVEGPEQLPDAHAAGLDGLDARGVVQNLFGVVAEAKELGLKTGGEGSDAVHPPALFSRTLELLGCDPLFQDRSAGFSV